MLTIVTDCCQRPNMYDIIDGFGNNRVRVKGACPACGAIEPLGSVITNAEQASDSGATP